jgi:hypothetical protein
MKAKRWLQFPVLILVLLAGSAYGAEPVPQTATLQPVKTSQFLRYAVTDISASETFSFTNPNAGPRDYMGLWNAAGTVRLDWRYLNDSWKVRPAAGVVQGSVTFPGLRAGSYQVRLYRWVDGLAVKDQQLFSNAFTIGPFVLTLPALDGTTVSVDREPGTIFDKVTVVRSDGNSEEITIARETIFEVVKATSGATSAAFAIRASP